MHRKRPAHAPEFAPPFFPWLGEEDDGGRRQDTEEADLEHRNLVTKRLDRGVSPGKAGVSKQSEKKTFLHDEQSRR